MSPWDYRLPPPSPHGWRRNWPIDKYKCAFIFLACLGITLVGLCATAYDQIKVLAEKQQDMIDYAYADDHRDNVTVPLYHSDVDYNLGKYGLKLHDQIRLLETLAENNIAFYSEWYLASTHDANGVRVVDPIPLRAQHIGPFDEEEFKKEYYANGGNEIDYNMERLFADFRHTDLQRMDQTMTEILYLLGGGKSSGNPGSQPGGHDRQPQRREKPSLPPLPTDIGGVPTHLPDEPELPTPTSSPLPPLDPVPTTIGPGPSPSKPPPPQSPTTDLVAAAEEEEQPEPLNLPDLIQLPTQMISLLKRVVARLTTNRSFPEILQKILGLVLQLLDKIQHDPEPTGPPTRPPIGKRPNSPTGLPPPPPGPPGKKPSLPPVPVPVPTSSKKPSLPPLPPLPTDPNTRPPIGKRPSTPTPPPKGPKPPGKGKGKKSDGMEDEDKVEMPGSGVLEAARRAAEDDGADEGAAPTAVVGTAAASSKKRVLTKEERELLHSAALVAVTDEVKKAHDKDPKDPWSPYINVPAGMAIFKRLARHAERWVGRNPDAMHGHGMAKEWREPRLWEDWEEYMSEGEEKAYMDAIGVQY